LRPTVAQLAGFRKPRQRLTGPLQPHAGRAAALACAFLAACAGAEAPAPPADSLVVGIEAAPTSLDPRAAVDATSAQITSLVFQGLTAPAGGGGVAPDLALAWEPVGQLGWRFHLRPAVFHDGSPVTAADVVATYRSLSLPALRGLHEELGAIERVEAEDDRTVLFTMGEPFAPFLLATTLGVVPASCAAQVPCSIGSGPFRLVRHGLDEVVLAAAETAEPPPRLPGIVFRASPDGTTRALGLAQGAIHLVQNAIEPELVPWLAARGLVVRRAPGTTFQYLGLNLRVPALSDPRVRRAISHAIDVDAIVAHVLAGLAVPAAELMPPGHWAHVGGPRSGHDPVLARGLLTEAGALPLRLQIKTSTVDLRRRIAEAIAADLEDVGIAVDVRPLEWAALYGDVRRGNFELVSLAWVGVQDPDLYFGWLHSAMVPPHGNNRGAYANPHLDALTERGRRTPDGEERIAIYAEVAREIAAEVPFVPLWWTDIVTVATPRLVGFTPTPTGDLRGLAAAHWHGGPPGAAAAPPTAGTAAGPT
jgi:peptide/nickel transport system substrate-binding protein